MPQEDPSQAQEIDPALDKVTDPEIEEAKAAWEGEPRFDQAVSEEELRRASQLAEPFVGQWNELISTTNWDKGRIVSEWRREMIESGVDATQYSDEAWSRRVGGVTAPHVGRLRRVYDRFADTFESYQGLYWSHFLAALDWEDAPMWLEGAQQEGWSISAMREKRWQAEGAVEANRPASNQIVAVDTDEDVTLPAQGGGSNREFDADSGSVASGPSFEGPDFGDEEELQSLSGGKDDSNVPQVVPTDTESEQSTPVQPFIGLPALPDDLTDALESFKLSLLRHKSNDWRDVELPVVERYLDAIKVMVRS
ncbi:MAG: hypothetical protein AAFU85_03070 [Planctomycetota bacterium]